MKTASKKKPHAKAQRRKGGKGKRPEVNLVGVYVSGVRGITVAQTAQVKARLMLVFDPRTEGWHVGYEVQVGKERRSSHPRQDGISYADKARAIAEMCRQIRGLIEAEGRYGSLAKKVQCRKAMEDVARFAFEKAAGRNDRGRKSPTLGARPRPARRSSLRASAAPREKSSRPGATGKNGDGDQFRSESFGLLPRAERFLRKHHVAKRDLGMWMMLLPARDGRRVSVPFLEWMTAVSEWLRGWAAAGWTQAPSGKEYQLQKNVDGVEIGIHADDVGLSAYAVNKGDPEFFSPTGYRSLATEFGARPRQLTPPKLEKVLLGMLTEHRQQREKAERRRLKRPGEPSSPPLRASAPSREIPSGPPPEPRALVAVLDTPAGVMSTEEVARLHSCEETIRQNLSGFLEVGNALATIQRGRLYRAKYARFEDYCREEWDFGKSYAHKLINGAAVVKQLEASPIVPAGKNGRRSDLPDQLVLPRTESQVRPLTRLANPDARREAWRKVLKSAPRGADNVPHVTAEIVEAVVADILPPRSKDEGSRIKEEERAADHPADGARGRKAEGTLTPAEYVRVTRTITAEIGTLCQRAGQRMREEIARFLHNLAAGIEEATLKARG
jgi:hypothetical protein